MPRLTLILACAAGAALTACSDPLASSAQRLAGSWTWVASCGGFTGQCTTPVSVGYTERVHFFPSLWVSGVAEWYRADTLFRRERYRLGRWEDAAGERLTIEYAVRIRQFVRFEGDTLILIDYCDDCFDHTYIRGP